ncbi:hypothetical protein Lal_00018856 [Lupinus albus]|nr:hypothetical protein Lal_00018856 [Lupinus albus]
MKTIGGKKCLEKKRQNYQNKYPRGGPRKLFLRPTTTTTTILSKNQFQHPNQDKSAKLEDTSNQFMQMTMNMKIQIRQLAKQLEEKGIFSTNEEANPREHCTTIMKG